MKKNQEEHLEAYLEQHSFLRETAELQLAMEKLMRNLVRPLRFPGEAEIKERLAKGVPLLQQEDLQQKAVEAMVRHLLKVLAELEKLPAAPEPFKAAARGLKECAEKASREDWLDFLEAVLRQEGSASRDFLAAHKLNEAFARSLIWQMAERLVPARLKEAAFWEQEIKWERNYCPVCGRRPLLAQLKKEMEGRSRYLICGGCHAMWRYARMGCAYCGNEDLNKMHILEPEEETAVRLDVCDKCHAYLKTYGEEGEEEIYLRDWATLHLDLLGEEKGLQKKGSIMLE